MATGTLIVFNEFTVSLAEKLINLETDTIKLALIDAVVTPTVDAATPMWSVGSDEDYDGNEVGTGGAGYSAGGMTISGPQFTRAVAVGTFDDDGSDLSLVQDGAGFTDARWGILYSDTSTLKNAIAFLDLGGAVSQVAGPITIAWNASGILTLTRT